MQICQENTLKLVNFALRQVIKQTIDRYIIIMSENLFLAETTKGYIFPVDVIDIWKTGPNTNVTMLNLDKIWPWSKLKMFI